MGNQIPFSTSTSSSSTESNTSQSQQQQRGSGSDIYGRYFGSSSVSGGSKNRTPRPGQILPASSLNTIRSFEIENSGSSGTEQQRNQQTSTKSSNQHDDYRRNVRDRRDDIDYLIQASSLWKIMHPREACEVLGPSIVRNMVRSYRRIVLAQAEKFGSTSNQSAQSNSSAGHSDGSASTNTNKSPMSSSSNTSSNSAFHGTSQIQTLEESEEDSIALDTILHLLFTGMAPSAVAGRMACRSVLTGGIDFITFSRQYVPPHTTVPMGVLECIFTGFCTTSYPNNSNGGGGGKMHRLKLCDCLIVAAVFSAGHNFVNYTKIDNSPSMLLIMERECALIFRVYESTTLQNQHSDGDKGGYLSQDILGKFIHSIYGPEYANSSTTARLLRGMFFGDELEQDGSSDSGQWNQTRQPSQPLPTPLSVKDFTAAILSQLHNYPQSHHPLLRWMEIFTYRILLPTPPSEFVRALDERYTHPDRAMHLLCARYKVSSLILFEIKRKFHSLAQLAKCPAVLTKSAAAADTADDIDMKNALEIKNANDEEGEEDCVTGVGVAATVDGTAVPPFRRQSSINSSNKLSLHQWLSAVCYTNYRSTSNTNIKDCSNSPIAGKDEFPISCLTENWATLVFYVGGCSSNNPDVVSKSTRRANGSISHPKEKQQDESIKGLHRVYSAQAPLHSTINGSSTSLSTMSVRGTPSTSATAKYLPEHSTTNGSSMSSPSISALDTTPISAAAMNTPEWTLYDILHFGCLAVRANGILTLKDEPIVEEDVPLLKFVYRCLLMLVRQKNGQQSPVIAMEAIHMRNNLNCGDVDGETYPPDVLTQKHVLQMICLLIEQSRLRSGYASAPQSSVLSEECINTIKREEASRVGLLSITGTQDESNDEHISISALCQTILISHNANTNKSSTTASTTLPYLTYKTFVEWHQTNPRALTPLLVDLKVIAGVILGVRPSTPIQERLIVEELFQRYATSVTSTTGLIGGRQKTASIEKKEEEKDQFDGLGVPGTTWYLISTRWMKVWDLYASSVNPNNVGQEQPPYGRNSATHGVGSRMHPTPIDNNSLLKPGPTLALRHDLKHGSDFRLLPPLVWSALQAWHDGGPPISRRVVASSASITSKNSTDSTELELYPHCVTLSLADKMSSGRPRPFQQWSLISRVEPLSQLVERLCIQLGSCILPGNVRLWLLNTTSGVGEVMDLGLSLREQLEESDIAKLEEPQQEPGIFIGSEGVILCLELKDEETGLWPRNVRDRNENDESNDACADQSQKEPSSPGLKDVGEDNEYNGDGIVGLYNMGNTCYLNSSLQCLSHTPMLRPYFTTKSYLNDINTTNPLGQQGRLAQVTAHLVCQLWKNNPNSVTQSTGNNLKNSNSYPNNTNHNNNNINDNNQQYQQHQQYQQQHHQQVQPPVPHTSLTPKSFKDAIGKFNDQFQGNEQHDAQELLAFLLSGLSEDLNRIVNKPYIEQPDSDGRPDKELADIWWKNHLLREMSIIVALFTGQYKSLLTCKTCNYESARFEPFAFLQLPLPEDDLITMPMIVFPVSDDVSVMKYSIRVQKDGTVQDALLSLSKVIYADEMAKKEEEIKSGNDMAVSNSETAASAKKNIEDLDVTDLSYCDRHGDDNNNEEEYAGDEEDTNNDSDDNEDDLVQEKYVRMSKNLAVVDMRECRVHSITPPNRSLDQIQYRETDALYVFEMEPFATYIKKANRHPHNYDASNESARSNEDIDQDFDTSSSSRDQQSQGQDKPGGAEDGKIDDGDGDEDASCSTTDEEENEENGSTSSQSIPSSSQQSSTKHSSVMPQYQKARPDYIAIAQRRLEPVPRPYIHPYVLRAFGTPLLLRLPLEQTTGRELYDFLAKRLARFAPDLPKVQREVLSSLHGGMGVDVGNRNKDITTMKLEDLVEISAVAHNETQSSCGKPTNTSSKQPLLSHPSTRTSNNNRNPISIDMEEVAGGEMPRLGFRARLTSRDGKRCNRCPWFDCCIGCLIPDDDSPTAVKDGDTVAVDWHLATPQSRDKPSDGVGIGAARLQTLAMNNVVRHRSCSSASGETSRGNRSGRGRNSRWEGKDITLEDCLDAFSAQEEIPEAYCSKCKEFRSSTKQMSVWRLPPVMIIHLKRFQFTQHLRRKLRNMVVFPLEGLDFSRIVTSGNQMGSGNSNEFVKQHMSDATTNSSSTSSTETATSSASSENISKDSNDDISSDSKKPSNQHCNSCIGSTGNGTESLYDLYGVVHHLGALSGGHYVASIRSEIDGKWRLFNDAQVTEISSRDIVDASAYILFYVRRDVKTTALEDFWDTTQQDGRGVTEEQIDKLVKQRERCIIS